MQPLSQGRRGGITSSSSLVRDNIRKPPTPSNSNMNNSTKTEAPFAEVSPKKLYHLQ
jgi:hypothetical protein